MRTVVIYGCGWSLNELTDKQWAELKQYDSIGFNWFILQKWIKPIYMIRGDIRPDKNVAALGKTIEESHRIYDGLASSDLYKDTIFLDNECAGTHWNKSTTIVALYWAKKLGYKRVIFVGVDLYDYRFFFLDRDELRVMVSRKPKKGKYVYRKLKKPHPIYKKILRWFDDHSDEVSDLEIYSYNPKSLLLKSEIIKLWQR